MSKHPQFVMSQFMTKEDLYKAKAEYFEKKCYQLEGMIEGIIASPT